MSNCFSTNFSDRLYQFLLEIAPENPQAQELLEEWGKLNQSGDYNIHCSMIRALNRHQYDPHSNLNTNFGNCC